MQIFFFITDYLQIKVTYLYLHFLTDSYGKEIIYLNQFEKYVKMQHFLKTPIRQ